MAFPEGYGPREHERALARLQHDIDNPPQTRDDATERSPAVPPRRAGEDHPPLRLVRVPKRDALAGDAPRAG